MIMSRDVLDTLLSGVENAGDLLGDHDLMKKLWGRLMERCWVRNWPTNWAMSLIQVPRTNNATVVMARRTKR